MSSIKVKIKKITDLNSFPGWVESSFIDIYNAEQVFNEKIPVVTSENLTRSSIFPMPGFIECKIIKESFDKNNKIYYTVTTEDPFGISNIDGKFIFDVYPSQIIND